MEMRGSEKRFTRRGGGGGGRRPGKGGGVLVLWLSGVLLLKFTPILFLFLLESTLCTALPLRNTATIIRRIGFDHDFLTSELVF